MKKFNVTGNCVPAKDYMVDITGKIAQIKKLIDNGYYFTINEARQYGKTTTLYELRRRLTGEYIVAHISFQGVSDENFASEENFCESLTRQISKALKLTPADKEYAEKWKAPNIANFDSLNEHITNMCEKNRVVLMIDEADNATGNRIFVKFLNMLREKYLARKNGDDCTFHSVILAGVYDIKNMKLKMITEGSYIPSETESKMYNSPWNIAADFDVDMSFNPAEIATMLKDYETDHKTGMNIVEISEEIYGYTSGYPFLVSRVCQCIDEKLDQKWTIDGIREAVGIILHEQNTLFDDLFKNLENNRDLYELIYEILIIGAQRTFTFGNPAINMGLTYGIIKRENQSVKISNKIFEIIICDYFISKDEGSKSKKYSGIIQQDILSDGRFDMELCLRKFADHYAELFNENDAKFLERHGRLMFLSYLKPLINGQGFYHIESQFTDLRRMDIAVDFGRDQFIIELKIWGGEKAEKNAYKQLVGYMETKKAEKGYLMIFDFRKEKNKERKTKWIDIDGKKIFEIII
ncbi:MAG: AAA-like domain-containing protein [Oscillospiraceae bacterium]|nr:AAA-like domain-containing protein [Oscillospiraceae bacterium]